MCLMSNYLSEARPKAERSSELSWQKKSEQKKSATTRRRPPILYLVKLFNFLSKFLPFSPFFILQKLSYVFHFHNLSKIHWQKTIFAKKFFWKKKKSKKIIHFLFFEFFFDFFIFIQNLLNIFFFLFYCNSSSSNKTKKRLKNASNDQYILIIYFILFEVLQKVKILKRFFEKQIVYFVGY